MNLLTFNLRYDPKTFDHALFTKRVVEVLKEFKDWGNLTVGNSPADMGPSNLVTLRDAIAVTIDGDAFAATKDGRDQLPNSMWILRRDMAYRKADAILALKPSNYATPPEAEKLRAPLTVVHNQQYECPVCNSNDKNRYLTCNHPACPDGRDPR